MSHKVCLLTSNVGSLFSKIASLRTNWLETLDKFIKSEKPDFLAIHLQEFGGKSKENTFSKTSCAFIRDIIILLRDKYKRGFIYVDGSMSSPSNYTALASLYFAGEKIKSPGIYNFETKEFTEMTHIDICTEIESNYITKLHFPSFLHMNNSTSRKGFIHTIWKIDQQNFNFVNLHLFHDESNIVSIQSSPSTYAMQRSKTLFYTISRIGEIVDFSKEKIFIFGDFNFRIDSCSYLADHYSCISGQNCYFFKDENSHTNATVSDKIFKLRNSFGNSLYSTDAAFLKQYDKEFLSFENVLCESAVTFPPSYLYCEEENAVANQFGDKRCPSWCDRILYSETAGILLDGKDSVYGMLGSDLVIGDHKPVYLAFEYCAGEMEEKEIQFRVILNGNDINIDENAEMFNLNLNK